MFVFDYGRCVDGTKIVEVSPAGWNGTLKVEYGLCHVREYDLQNSIVWHVVGTKHSFTIYETRINRYSNGDYRKHFEEVLANFRYDYLSWFRDDRYDGCEWRDGYEREFGSLILPDEDGDILHYSEKNKIELNRSSFSRIK